MSLMPEGLYEVVVASQAFGPNHKGTDSALIGIDLKGRVDPNAPDGKTEKVSGRRTIRLYFTAGAGPISIKQLVAMGMDLSSGELSAINNPDYSMKGNEFFAYCKHEADDKGVIQERWQAQSEVTVTVLSGTAAKAVDDRYRDMVKAAVATSKPGSALVNARQAPPRLIPNPDEV